MLNLVAERGWGGGGVVAVGCLNRERCGPCSDIKMCNILIKFRKYNIVCIIA